MSKSDLFENRIAEFCVQRKRLCKELKHMRVNQTMKVKQNKEYSSKPSILT